MKISPHFAKRRPVCTPRAHALASSSVSAGSINMEADMTRASQRFPV